MPTLTRQELYDSVWSTPMAKLAREFGISASFATEPLGEETLLPLTTSREIAPEERPEPRVSFDSLIEPHNQRVDRRRATCVGKNIAPTKRRCTSG